MNKIIIGVALAALLVITGIVVYQFAQQQYAIQRIDMEDQNRINFDACMSQTGNYTWCDSHRGEEP